MMIILRCLLVVICSLGGAIVFWETLKSQNFALIGGCMGFLVSILILIVEQRVKNISFRVVIGGVFYSLSG
ncbi:MAG: hypothetical protein JRC57_09695 [Deltaproteobacteria bacterium]|nr:hypothetical protein [Deltaproteobacteria bacterium]